MMEVLVIVTPAVRKIGKTFSFCKFKWSASGLKEVRWGTLGSVGTMVAVAGL